MSPRKTVPTGANVAEFLQQITDSQQRADCLVLIKMMQHATKAEGQMWGNSIVGFGELELTNAGGRQSKWFQLGFAPRRRSLTLYLMNGFDPSDPLLRRLGKHRQGKCCLYVNHLDDLDPEVLRQLFEQSVKPNRDLKSAE